MTISHIPEKGLSGGIILITESSPTSDELEKACADFHNYPVIRDSAIVVFLDRGKLSANDLRCLDWLNVPGYSDGSDDD